MNDRHGACEEYLPPLEKVTGMIGLAHFGGALRRTAASKPPWRPARTVQQKGYAVPKELPLVAHSLRSGIPLVAEHVQIRENRYEPSAASDERPVFVYNV